MTVFIDNFLVLVLQNMLQWPANKNFQLVNICKNFFPVDTWEEEKEGWTELVKRRVMEN